MHGVLDEERITLSVGFGGPPARLTAIPVALDPAGWSPGIEAGGRAIALLVHGAALPSAPLDVALCLEGAISAFQIAQPVAILDEESVCRRLAPAAGKNPPTAKSRAVQQVNGPPRRLPPTGAADPASVLVVEAAVACGTAGTFISGWLLAPCPEITALTVSVPDGSWEMQAADMFRVNRPDVVDLLGAAERQRLVSLGFLALIPLDMPPGTSFNLRVADAAGGWHGCTALVSHAIGSAAAKEILARPLEDVLDLRTAFDAAVGPAVRALSAAERRLPCTAAEVSFGMPADHPDCSLVIPLHGRVDLMEAQLGLLSRDPYLARCDIIYVVDDPPQRAAALALAASCHARFGLAFRLLTLQRNAGFAIASNTGLRAARAAVTCFMNSDVLPITPGGIFMLARRARWTVGAGAVSALLLYADGSVQHAGMSMGREETVCGWHFPRHPGKGRRPGQLAGFVPAEAVTGAVLAIRTDLARAFGGFDEAFLVGDFEDSDLCLRLARAGHRSFVDLDVRFHHLERLSQARAPWRAGITAYNAWLHEARWYGSV